MRRTLLLVVLGAVFAVVGLGFASAAQSYDRRPVVVSGLRPDGWSMATTHAAAALRNRYSDVGYIYCVGVIMDGYRADSSFVEGSVRYWDKLLCFVDMPREYISFIYDQKGAKQNTFTIYRMKHFSK
jgi:hypothetical protein